MSLKGFLQIWDLEQKTELYSLKAHDSIISTVVVTSDSQYMVSTSWDYQIKIWELLTGKFIASFTGESRIDSCALSPDGEIIVVGESSGNVHFLRLQGVRST